MNLRKLRDKYGLKQAEFWQRVGITQSGGSRYENENRNVPKPLMHLLNIAYGDDKTFRETIKLLRP